MPSANPAVADPLLDPGDFGVSAHARATPDKVAVVQGAHRLTYATLDGRVNQAARTLASMGVGRGDRVLLVARNSPAHLEVALGVARRRGEVVGAPRRATADELAYLCRDADVRVAVVEPEAAEAASGLGVPVLRLDEEYETALAEQSRDALEDAPRLDYVFRHAYTSGTTGRPKAIELPGFNPFHALAHTVGFQRTFGIDGPNERNLALAPMHHLAGWSFPHSALLLGQTTVLVDGFDAEQVLALIERERITHANFVPLHFIRIAALDRDVVARYDVSSVRRVLHGSAPCPVDVKHRMMEIFGDDTIWETYGGSEGFASLIGPDEWRARPGSVGRPAVDAKILDAEGVEQPTGHPGLVYLAPRGGVRFTYRGDPEQSASIWRDGLFTLGDIGYLDDAGYLFLVDRAKDVIITGGENVYPAEVELAVRSHPDVVEVAVIGVPDVEWGERIRAVVVAATNVTEDEIIAHARSRLVKAKCPREVVFVDELPRDPMGKVRKRDLRDDAWAGHARRI